MRDPGYLTAGEVAERLGISLRTVRRRIADGSLPAVRIGRAVRIPIDALKAPSSRLSAAAFHEAAARYGSGADEPAASVAAWNAANWPDSWDRMLDRRRRAFAQLEAIRAQTRPPTGQYAAVDAILEAADNEWDERLGAILAAAPPRSGP